MCGSHIGFSRGYLGFVLFMHQTLVSNIVASGRGWRPPFQMQNGLLVETLTWLNGMVIGEEVLVLCLVVKRSVIGQV